jgi:acyl-CoA thioesterase
LTRFDDDTALAPFGERRWTGYVAEHWYVGRGANGGLLAAQAVRAMEELAGDPERVPRSVTIHYLEAPTAGPLELAGAVERSGRATTSVSLRMQQGGRTVALALGALAVWRDGQRDHLAGEPPRVPRPDELEPLDPSSSATAPVFMSNYEWRWLPPGAGAEVAGWIRAPGGRPVDHVAVAAFADAFPPAVFPLIGWKPAGAPTIDLTIHFRAPLREVGDGWVLATFRSRRVSGGFFEEDGELWSEGGVLLAQSRQLAMLRELG